MKKKFITFLLAICFMIPCVFMLTACGGGGNSDEDKNPEFTQFSTQVVAIMSAVDMTASEDNAETVALSSKNASLKSGKTIKLMSASMSTSEIETVFDMFKNHDDAESVDDVNAEYSSCLETCFCFPLGIGDIITNKHGATNFYDIKARVDLGSGFGYGSFVVENSGNTTEIYLFDPSVEGEGYLYITMTYNSKADYQLEFINYTQNLNNFIYAYVDSSQNFINLQKHTPANETAQYGGYVSNGMSCFYIDGVRGEQIQTYTENLISEKNPHQYDSKINETKTGAKYTISLAEVNEAYEKYVGESNEGDEAYPIYVNKDGVAGSVVVGDDFDCPTVIIPAKATALDDGLMLNPNCTKIVVPDSVTSIKIRKNTAYWWQFGEELSKNDPTRNDYVDAPVAYVLENFRITAGYNWETTKQIEIVFSENSKLFKTGADGNTYLTYGGNEYLAYIKNWESDIIKNLDGTNTKARNDFRNGGGLPFANFTENAREQLKKSNYKFQSITLHGDTPISDYITTDGKTPVETYTVDTVTCYGTFYSSMFYRTDYGNYVENSQRITRIKELIIKPEFYYELPYMYDPESPLSPEEQFNSQVNLMIDAYYQETGVMLTYWQMIEIMESGKAKIVPEEQNIEIEMDDKIQIDKITVDPSVKKITLEGHFGQNTVLDIPNSVQVHFSPETTQIESEGKYYVNRNGNVSWNYDLDDYLGIYTGKVEFVVPHTQAEFDYLRTVTLVDIYNRIYNMSTTQSDKYKITYTENIDIMGIVNSDLTPYFDYTNANTYHQGLRYTSYYGEENNVAYEGFYLYLTNMVEKIDFTKYVNCATGWDYKVYYETYDEDLQKYVYVENDGKVVNLTLGESLDCKLVGTNSQMGETKNLYITFDVDGESRHTVSDYSYDTYDMSDDFSGFKAVVVKDSSDNVIQDLANIPLEYGENVFKITVTNDYGTSTYKHVVTRPYNVVNIKNSTAVISFYDYTGYAHLEREGFEIKLYDIQGNEIVDKNNISLNIGDNIIKAVFTWKGEGEVPRDYSDYDGKIEARNYYRAAE